MRFDCAVKVDDRLKESLQISWYKNGDKLSVEYLDLPGPSEYEYEDSLETTMDYLNLNGSEARYFLLPNASLHIRGPTTEDVGNYR